MKSNRRPHHEFMQHQEPGDVNCIISDNKRKLISTLHVMAITMAETKNVGYLVTKKQYGKQNIYLQSNSISQSLPLHSLQDIEDEIARLTWISECPIIIIKDYFETISGLNSWEEQNNNVYNDAAIKLKKIASKYKVTIYVSMLFISVEDLKKYILFFDWTGNGLIRSKAKEFYFDKQLCLYRSKDYSQKARTNLHRQLILAHPGLKSIEKNVIVSSIIGQGNILWFNNPFPYIYVGTPFLFDKRLIPSTFKGYKVLRTSCGLPFSRYFPKDKSVAVEVKYSPDNLIRFVDNHLELIAWKLDRPELTMEEALEALTGGFEAHKVLCTRLNDERSKTTNI